MHGIWETLNKLYVNNGLRIIPLRPNSKLPSISNWGKESSSNFLQILYWIENNKNGNWGLPCLENNLFVLDLDTGHSEENGVENFERLLKDLGIESCETLKQRTKSNGIHLIFQSDDDLKKVCGAANAFKDYPAIDLRNSNYIVVEPSVIDGMEYKFLNNMEPQPMPPKLKEFIINNADKKGDKKKTPYKKPKEVVECGGRDIAIFEYISNLYRKTDLDIEEIEVLAQYFNENNLEEPFTEKEVSYKVKKAFEKPRLERILLYLGGDENDESKGK